MGSTFGSDNRGICHLGLYGIPFSEITAEADTQVLGGLKTGIHQMKRLPIQMSHIHFQVARNIMRFQDTIRCALISMVQFFTASEACTFDFSSPAASEIPVK